MVLKKGISRMADKQEEFCDQGEKARERASERASESESESDRERERERRSERQMDRPLEPKYPLNERNTPEIYCLLKNPPPPKKKMKIIIPILP